MFKKIVFVLATVCALALAYFYFISPRVALDGMMEAYNNRDAQEFSSYIDFDRLRESLKTEMAAQAAQEALFEDDSDDPFGEFGAMAGAAISHEFVDSLVNPTAVRIAFASRQKTDQRFLALPAEDAKIVRDSIGRFRIQGSDGEHLVFESSGISWKLVGVELPIEDGKASAAGRTASTSPGSVTQVPSDMGNPPEITAQTLTGDWASDLLECASDAPLRLRPDGIIPAFAGSLEEPIDASWSFDGQLVIRSDGETYRYDVRMPDWDSLVLAFEDDEQQAFVRC